MFGYKITRDPLRDRPYKVGLALSGGGARGVAHAGAIKAMLEVGLKPDIVAGVSAGAIVAAMYAAGITPEDMVEIFATARFTDFAELSVPKDGFFRLDGFKRMLKKKIPYANIEDLPMPVVIAATDFDHGRKVAFESGPLAERVCASCSIPVVFKPVRINGVRYVDGGVLDNMPAWAIRSRCKFLVGVNCSPVSHSSGPKTNIVSIALRSYELMMKNNSAADLQQCDMVITPDEIADYKVFNLQGLKRVFRAGYNATMDYFRSKGIEV
ncbi:MAG: patatin-like phospholipase family protein [Firmicutes bacterium]|nr:patatin-like phospholipase family protein [Bacillota bacterium]MCM1400579.1 patatin-like phospholipase family protein [Bacteroides sp.]MCM1477494.1 patatin-like phospholipase family protein [Bacteroides sp.]